MVDETRAPLRLVAEFYIESFKDEAASRLAGQTIMRELERVRIRIPDPSGSFYASEIVKPVDDSHRQRWGAEYADFRASLVEPAPLPEDDPSDREDAAREIAGGDWRCAFLALVGEIRALGGRVDRLERSIMLASGRTVGQDGVISVSMLPTGGLLAAPISATSAIEAFARRPGGAPRRARAASAADRAADGTNERMPEADDSQADALGETQEG